TLSPNACSGGLLPDMRRLERAGGVSMSSRCVLALFTFALVMHPCWAGLSQGKREARTDYYKKWLEGGVVYVITPQGKAVFSKLTAAEEKDQFIEQFWARRDPDPSTSANEFKEEHYRRLQYANERFAAGKPGWRTDRGRFYIKFGKPDDVETHAGGPYA